MFSVTQYIPQNKLIAFCRVHHIVKLSIFGSALRNELRDDSDIDILVEFAPGLAPGLLGLATIELELSRVFGRKADVRTPAELSRFFRQEVLSTARVEYAA